MTTEIELLLLRLVKSNGNISPVIKMGYQYSQVIGFLDVLIEEKKLMKQNNKITITELGREEIDLLNKKFRRSNSSLWIEPATQNKITKIGINDIFLPDQDDLSF